LLNDTEILNLLSSNIFNTTDKLLFILVYQDDKPKTNNNIRDIGIRFGFTKIKKTNITQLLKSSKGKAASIPEGWVLTIEGKNYLYKKDIPELKNLFIENSIRELRKYFADIKDKNTLSFLNETITCLERGLKRAAVVLAWVGAISVLQDVVITNKLSDFNVSAKKKFKEWKDAKTKDDLSNMKDFSFLEILEAISLIGKSVKDELQNTCLKLRNGCGHPNSLEIGETRVAAHIEMLILNVFSKF
jgi:hypothetical protein